jgi:hypothetical protein
MGHLGRTAGLASVRKEGRSRRPLKVEAAQAMPMARSATGGCEPIIVPPTVVMVGLLQMLLGEVKPARTPAQLEASGGLAGGHIEVALWETAALAVEVELASTMASTTRDARVQRMAIPIQAADLVLASTPEGLMALGQRWAWGAMQRTVAVAQMLKVLETARRALMMRRGVPSRAIHPRTRGGVVALVLAAAGIKAHPLARVMVSPKVGATQRVTTTTAQLRLRGR